MEIDRTKYLEIIKVAYISDFNRTLTNKEGSFILDTVLKHMRSELSKLPDFSEKFFIKYITANGGSLTYSPKCVYEEINRAIDTVGVETFSKDRGYKRTREMELAARMCLTLKKKFNEQWMIKIQDNPDVVIFKVNNGSIKSNFMDAVQLEIMAIPEVAKKQWNGGNFVGSLLKFIREKKFNKRYGICSLMVNLDFDHQSIGLKQASNFLTIYKGNNPYERIFITAITSQDLKTVSVIQIYPDFSKIDFNIDEEGLLY